MKVAVIVLAVVAIIAAAVAGFAIWKMDSGVEVPSVVGQKLADAKAEMSGAGLAHSIEHTYSDSIEKGTIARQQPAGGEKAAQGSTVVLWVSDGASQVSVPDVAGQTVTKADALLTADGLNAKAIAGSSSDVEKGQIYEQVPAAGSKVPRGSIITVYYSQSGPTVVVPALTGLTQTQAAQRLNAAHLYLGTVGTKQSSTAQQGTVISQSVPASERVARGSTVSIVVSSGTPEPVVPDVLNMPYKQAQNKLTALGFQVRTTWKQGTGMMVGAVVKVVPSVGTPAPEGSVVHIYVEENGSSQ